MSGKSATARRATLLELTEEWATAKKRADEANAEVERLRAEILLAGAEVGYADPWLQIAPNPKVAGVAQVYVLENKRLERVLRAESLYRDSLETRPSLARVRELAERNVPLARTLKAITSYGPRFNRAKAG